MRFLIFYTIGILYVYGLRTDKAQEVADALLSEVSKNDDLLLDESLHQGLVDGYTFTLDCVTMSKHEHDHEEPTQKQLNKEHEDHLKQAELEADHMTKHRPLESQKVKKKEATLFSNFNILLHYLTSRGQTWELKEPSKVNLEDNDEKHMVFQSEANDSADIKIPVNMFYTVGNMKKSIPVHKDNKKPILLTCLESFIVSRMGYICMQNLTKSDAPVEDKLEYMKRWIQIAKNHYVLYLPYIAVTAPRCYDLLKKDDSDELNSDYENNNHYKRLFDVCKKMLEMRNNDGTLQTYVMLDSDLHKEIMKKTLEDQHLFPLLLQDRENNLKSIHQHFEHEMSWDEFQAAGNLLLAELEQQLLRKDATFLKPETWGIGLNADESKKAEMELIKLFVQSQKKLNFKVIQTIRAVSHESLQKSNKGDDELKKSMLKFAEKEEEAAKKESSSHKSLKKCMEEAEKKLDEDFQTYTNTNQSNIATKLQNFEHDSWMECMSSRIFTKLVDVCNENDNYCLNLMDKLDKGLENADPDSTSTIAMENLNYAVTVALLKNDKIKMDDVKKHILKVSKQEIKDMSEPANQPAQVSENQQENNKDNNSTNNENEKEGSSNGSEENNKEETVKESS